ncbi:MAG: c-type cytochrome [Planctomycetes bacterium]|nr:c-type cytochrome [Planctomycetota bacterium]
MLVGAGVVGSVILIVPHARPRAKQEPSTVQSKGQSLYIQNCAGCHGNDGRGDGPAAKYLNPKPRDFSTGLFKLTSTPQSELPTDEDLLRTITNGMPGSAMPSWELLSDPDRREVVTYIKTLVKFYDEDEQKWINRYEMGDVAKPVAIPEETQRSLESTARGKLAFRKAECFKCHGNDGRGDGQQAASLKDTLGFPIRPRDFTAGIFKGGNEPKDIFKRISTGLNGTPMPAHDQALTVAERWDLVHFILSLGRPGAQEMAKQTRRNITVHKMPPSTDWSNPKGAAWDRVPDLYIALMPLWWREHRTEGLLVKAAHDGTNIYIRIAWEDATMNNTAVRSEDFRDGVAIQFARTPDAPFIAMGAGVEDVNIWLWKAERNGGPEALAEVETQYPNYDVLDYPEMQDWKPGTANASKRRLRDMGPKFAAGWAAGNPVSDPNVKSPVENLAAHGFSTLTHLKSAMEHVSGKGLHATGSWTVVMSRPIAAADTTEAALDPGRHIPVAFAVWDGDAGDRNGQKSITIWHDLEIQR